MNITWNPVKAKANKLKHGINFDEVLEVFIDVFAITIEDPDANDESRFISVGLDSLGRIVVVVYTYADSSIRIISARRASKSESKAYEKRIRL